MSLPQFCSECFNALGDINFTDDTMTCTKCLYRQDITGANKIIAVEYFNQGKRILSTTEILRVAHRPSTQRIEMDCASCKYNIMAAICDEDKKFTFVCLKCNNYYSPA
jgi:hypothetical protein